MFKGILKKLLPEKGIHYWLHCHRKRVGWRIKARLRNEVFGCRALQGESNYNICINCDLTVSCNCRDFAGSGQLGSLREGTLEQIFHGERAENLRRALARGQFPLSNCPTCAELCLVPKERSSEYLTSYRVPHRGIMVENTILCNLRCSFCSRDDLLRIRKRKTLSVEDTQQVAALLNNHKIENLYYFNLGEPFLPTNILDQMRMIRAQNPGIRIVTSTNGMLLDNDDKREAALLMDYIYISLDGIDNEMVGRYQIGSNFEKVYGNMVRLMELRRQRNGIKPIVEWKYVLFRWNDLPEHVEKAMTLARKAGVDLLAFYPGEAPLHKRSLRYLRASHFRAVGEKIGDAIVININNIHKDLIAP
jgi:pyruvate-formate lyase-activating enzyme